MKIFYYAGDGKRNVVAKLRTQHRLANHVPPSSMIFHQFGKLLVDNGFRFPARTSPLLWNPPLYHRQSHRLDDAWLCPIQTGIVEQLLGVARQHDIIATLFLEEE